MWGGEAGEFRLQGSSEIHVLFNAQIAEGAGEKANQQGFVKLNAG